MQFEPFSRAHVPLLSPLLGDPDTLRWTRIPEPPQPGFGEDWADRCEAGRAEGTKEGFAALDVEADIAYRPKIFRAAAYASELTQQRIRRVAGIGILFAHAIPLGDGIELKINHVGRYVS